MPLRQDSLIFVQKYIKEEETYYSVSSLFCKIVDTGSTIVPVSVSTVDLILNSICLISNSVCNVNIDGISNSYCKEPDKANSAKSVPP